jgi:clorobiocin biosynthesis protein CloN6
MGRPYGLMPVGVAALINRLRENGIRVTGLNYPMERRLNPTFDLKSWLKAHPSVRVILIDVHWYEHCYGAISVAQVCKEALPGAWTVLGGLTASGFAREILENFSAVDFVIRGDAEVPLLDLVQRLLQGGRRRAQGAMTSPLLAEVPNLSYRDGGQVIENERTYCATTEDLDRLNFVDIDFLEHVDEYYVHEYIVTDLQRVRSARESGSPADVRIYRGRWLCNARGCRYECSYCGGCKSAHQSLAGRKGIVSRSPAKMVEDLERLERGGVIQASLSYDLAELGQAYWHEFLTRLRRSGVKIGLYNELFQLPKPEFIDEFVSSVDMEHSCLALSPLSGSEEVRRLNGKFYSNDELLSVLEHLNQYNVSIFVYFSLNLPGEDDRTMRDSVALAERIYQFYPRSLLKILTSSHTMDPLAPMSVRPAKYAIETNMSTFMDYYAYCRATQLATPEARTEAWRGFRPGSPDARSLEAMADAWDRARRGRESSWWPVPPGW